MELIIYNPKDDGFVKEISWNYDEIKKEVAEKVQHYNSLIYTEDQVKEAKADRATLRKFVDALEAKRKEIKKQCLAPYETFEKQMKEIVAIVNEPIALIDNQVKGYEDKQKAEKLEKIKAYYIDVLDKPEWLDFGQIYNDKWLNTSYSFTKVQADLIKVVADIAANEETLKSLPEFSFEALEVYKQTLNMNTAIAEGKRLLELQQRKAEMKAAQEQAAKVEETVKQEPMKTTEEILNTEVKKQWVAFQAYLSPTDAQLLKAFFVSRNIEFKPIQA